MRKTFHIQALLDAHRRYTLANKENPEFLRGINWMLEGQLHATGNYSGFVYIDCSGRVCGLDHQEFCEHRRSYA